MHYRLFIVTLERFGTVSYTRYIDFFRLPLPQYYLELKPHHHATVISVDPHPSDYCVIYLNVQLIRRESS